MTTPPSRRPPRIHFEDFEVGAIHHLGAHTFTRDEIIGFASRYDPQSFHLDDEAARDSIYGGLIASGWQTGSVCFRLAVDGFLGEAASLGSPGIDELRWLAPVRPGDTITARAEVLEARPSRSKPDRGIVRIRYDAHNQRGEHVFSMIGPGLFRRRNHTSAG